MEKKLEKFNKLMSTKYKKGNSRQIKFLIKTAQEEGVKIPKHITTGAASERQMNNFASKIMRKIKDSGIDTSTITQLEKTKNKLNKVLKETGGYKKIQHYIRTNDGSGRELGQLNTILFYAMDKDKLSTKDLFKISKIKGQSLKRLINSIDEKVAQLYFTDDLADIMRFYGGNLKDIKETKDLFNNANVKQRDYMLKIFANYGKGIKKYKETLSVQFDTKDFLMDKIRQVLQYGVIIRNNGAIEYLTD